jgi:hypothetical protein
MTQTDEERAVLSEEWEDLEEAGEVPPEGAGETAKRAERDKKREESGGRRRMPSEDDRVGRKISPTLSGRLVARLRAICKAAGHIDKDGKGQIASSVIEDLLWIAVEAYDRGELEAVEEVVEVRRTRLRRESQ